MKLSRRQKWLVAIGILAVLAIPAWYLASPLFTVRAGTEALPEQFTIEVARGMFVNGEPGHHNSGDAILLSDGTRYLLRVENFSVTNGPDIHVFLAAGPRVASGDLDLGPVTVTQGSANYAIPAGSNLQQFGYVVIWCVPFSVQFGYAALTFH